MTIDSRAVRIPSWVISVVVPLVIVILGYFFGLNSISAKTEVRVDHLHEEVVELKAGKASSEKVEGVITRLDDMQQSLKRIEDYMLNSQ
jgi:hypothetical protein